MSLMQILSSVLLDVISMGVQYKLVNFLKILPINFYLYFNVWIVVTIVYVLFFIGIIRHMSFKNAYINLY